MTRVLTKKEFAIIVGVSSRTLSRWLNRRYYDELVPLGYVKGGTHIESEGVDMAVRSVSSRIMKEQIPHKEACAKTQFKKGNSKGINTRFKNGSVPWITRAEMSLSDRKSNGRFERYIKISGKWRMYSHYVWEQATGQKMGARDVIRFVDGNHFNFDIHNLRKATRGEIMCEGISRRVWTEEEVEMLKRIYNHTQGSDLVKIFNRSHEAIGLKANLLGLVKNDDYLPDVSIAICLHRKKDSIRDAILENKSLIEFKRAQILLSRKIKQAHGNSEKSEKDME
jgi:hypothetical protein